MLRNYSSLIIAIFLILGVILTTIASLVFLNPWLTIILGAAIPYPIYLMKVRLGEYKSACAWIFFWAFWQSIAVILASYLTPTTAEVAIFSSRSYTAEMLDWIRTGEGPEGSLRLFLPIHLLHYTLFSLLSLLSFGSGALILGTWMLNYMNFYVGELVRVSVIPWLALLIGWPPWSMLRVMGYIATGMALTVLSLNLLARWRGKTSQNSFPQTYFLLGLGLVLGDILVKAFLAPFWQKFLQYALLG